MNHITVGVYASGKHTINIVRDCDLKEHIEYNTTMRFGRGLFVDGECIHKGYLVESDITYWKEKIKSMDINTFSLSPIYN